MKKLPPLTEKPLIHVDATPDKYYPLRILEVYRQNCNCRWASDTDGSAVETNPLLKAMNDANDERAKWLDKAIEVLKKHYVRTT